jgi:hypothetical protein
VWRQKISNFFLNFFSAKQNKQTSSGARLLAPEEIGGKSEKVKNKKEKKERF